MTYFKLTKPTQLKTFFKQTLNKGILLVPYVKQKCADLVLKINRQLRYHSV